MTVEKPFWGSMPGKAIEVNIRKMQTLAGLDAYGLSLANQHHEWRPKERAAFECRARELKKSK